MRAVHVIMIAAAHCPLDSYALLFSKLVAMDAAPQPPNRSAKVSWVVQSGVPRIVQGIEAQPAVIASSSAAGAPASSAPLRPRRCHPLPFPLTHPLRDTTTEISAAPRDSGHRTSHMQSGILNQYHHDRTGAMRFERQHILSSLRMTPGEWTCTTG